MDDPEPPSVVDGPSLVWQPDQRRSRKSGCSNIFAGVNLRQLKRLFHVAGDRDAEQRARLVLAGGQRNGEEEEKAREEGAVEAGLAQTLVGFRVKGRRRSGIRTEGPREPKWLKAFGHLRIKEGLNESEEDKRDPSDFKELDPLPGGSVAVVPPEDPHEPLERPPVGRPGATTRQEAARGVERYLHRILH